MTSTASIPAYLLPGVTVAHPPHLEGDPTLATEILPGPPSLASIRQLPKKTDPRRPFASLSYLPVSDPGTTYSGLAGGMSSLEEGGPRRKRVRIDKGSTNRAQRASARGLTNYASSSARDGADYDTASSSQLIPDSDPFPLLIDEDIHTLSRSASIPNLGEGSSRHPNGMTRKVGQTKEKGKERASIRIKEEPVATLIPDALPTPPNEDHCSSCTSLGALIYCDGCPRAFHLWCLDPPMESSDLPEGDGSWYCPKCRSAHLPPSRPPPSFLSPLVSLIQAAIPTEFQLPEDIRNYFRDVATGPRGTYVDNSSIKPPRIGRHGFGEERDPYRLRDNRGVPVLCFGCRKSALPDVLTASAPPAKRQRRSSTAATRVEQWKTMVSCDYCNLHWHLDCLNPPLSSLPPLGRKWKCPNHANNVAPKRRIPKETGPPTEITQLNQYNNGNIEIVDSQLPAPDQDKVPVGEALINGRRYRVPERVIVLDFWSKIRKNNSERTNQLEALSIASSPLTSLSSLDDVDEVSPLTRPSNDDTLRVAHLLCHMQDLSSHSYGVINENKRRVKEIGIQTEPDTSVRLEAKDTEHLSGLMKAALKELVPDTITAVLDTPRKVATPNNSRSTKQHASSSSEIVHGRTAVNGKAPSRTTRRSRPQTTPAIRDTVIATNGNQTIEAPNSLSHTTPKRSTPASSSNDIESKPLTIRIPRLIKFNRGPNNVTDDSSSSTPAVSQPVAASPTPNHSPSKRLASRCVSLRRKTPPSTSNGIAAVTGVDSLIEIAPKPTERQGPSVTPSLPRSAKRSSRVRTRGASGAKGSPLTKGASSSVPVGSPSGSGSNGVASAMVMHSPPQISSKVEPPVMSSIPRRRFKKVARARLSPATTYYGG